MEESYLSKLAALEQKLNDCKPVLKELFSKIWKSSPKKISNVVDKIVERISKSKYFIKIIINKILEANRSEFDNLILRLNEQNPGGDVGVLAPIFLNHFIMKPGQASFIGPNEPHAYLYGGNLFKIYLI